MVHGTKADVECHSTYQTTIWIHILWVWWFLKQLEPVNEERVGFEIFGLSNMYLVMPYAD